MIIYEIASIALGISWEISYWDIKIVKSEYIFENGTAW